MANSVQSQPFHDGEVEIQRRLGLHERVMSYAPEFIRSYMPLQHQQFYSQLPMFFVGSVDSQSRPWASVVFGRPGFLQAQNPKTLRIATKPVFGDPLNHHLAVGAPMGFLGIEYQTRRRNRLNGKVTAFGEHWFEIGVDQSFGNCPQYIQSRHFEMHPDVDLTGKTLKTQKLKKLNPRAKAIISSADNFYIATHFMESPDQLSHGTDISHRGGKTGFVKVDGDKTLVYPDFAGNNHFNTLGNIQKNPRAGLLFIDFKRGDLLLLTCSAKINWDGREVRDFRGAKRLVSFEVLEGILLEKAMPIRWGFLEDSPELAYLGSWEEVAAKKSKAARLHRLRKYEIVKTEQESEDARSFYLKPKDQKPLDSHLAGQFLPIKVPLAGHEQTVSRAYTISNAPNNRYLRLTIKRLSGSTGGSHPGLVSSLFHDNMVPGCEVQARPPAGNLTLDPSSCRPVVLVSAGIGITPMISLLEQLNNDRASCGGERGVWFIHGARHSGVHSFRKQVRLWQKNWPQMRVHFRYSRPRPEDRKGVDFDSYGRIDLALLKSLLPLDDYEFYLCGPSPFMQSLYGDLKSLNVSDSRINYEFFGKGLALKKAIAVHTGSDHREPVKQQPILVKFAQSELQAEWGPSKGTLLDLAESEGLQPPNRCRSGMCNTCSTKILAGEVAYRDPEVAVPVKGQALICSSYPVETEKHGAKLVLDL